MYSTFPELSRDTNFQAELKEVFTADRGIYVDPKIGRAVVKSGGLTVLGIVGSRYGVVNNAPIYEILCDGIQRSLPYDALDGVQLTEKTSRGGAFTQITLTFPGMGQEIRQMSGSSTQLNFKADLTNTFDGSGSIRLKVGAVDLVCTNGLTVDQMHRKAVKHTSGFTPEIFASFISEQCLNYRERVITWQRWANKEITSLDAQTMLEKNGFSDRRIKQVMDQMEVEFANRGRTVWATYSALTHYSSHSEGAFKVRKSEGSDNAAFTLDKRDNEVSRIISSNSFLTLAA
tara:strand:+ start:1490 stop:2353 length:864 start_codon:yes stop_codon:yes gene_type:complete